MEEKTKNNEQNCIYETPVVFCYRFDVETLCDSGKPGGGGGYDFGGNLDGDDWGD